MNAVDSAPGISADTYASIDDCIRSFMKEWMDEGYLDSSDWRNHGTYLGDKSSGINVSYASDPYWGEKAAAHAWNLDFIGGNKDCQIQEETPNVPNEPETDVPETPDVPSEPETNVPETPDVPSEPEINAPETPDVPSEPETPDVPSEPETNAPGNTEMYRVNLKQMHRKRRMYRVNLKQMYRKRRMYLTCRVNLRQMHQKYRMQTELKRREREMCKTAGMQERKRHRAELLYQEVRQGQKKKQQ